MKILSSSKMRTKIFYAFLILVIVPLISATTWFYVRIEQMSYNNMIASSQYSLMQVKENMTDIMKNISVARYVLIMNQGGITMLNEYVRRYGSQEQTYYSYDHLLAARIENIDFLLNNVLNAYLPDGSRITMYDLSDNAISIPLRTNGKVNVEYLNNDKHVNELLSVDIGSPSLWVLSHGDFTLGNNMDYISYMQLLRQTDAPKKFFFAVSIPEKYVVENVLGNGLIEGSSMLLSDQEGKIITYAGNEVSGTLVKNHLNVSNHFINNDTLLNEEMEDMMMLSINLPFANWMLTMVIPRSSVLSQIRQVRTQYMTILFLSFLTFVVCTYWLLHRITEPIEKLTGYIGEAEKGNLDIEFEIKSRDEIGVLAKSFQRMLHEIRLLMKQKVYEEKKRNEYKYKALQAQINPHFLFNTLNSIKWLAIRDNNNNVAELIASLGRLMEMSLFRGEEDIPFQEELKNVESYIELQKSRYGEIFTVKYDINDDIKQCACPKLLLQPIVENSIIHGIASVNRKCELRISAKVTDEKKTVCISVSDNGAGMSAEKLQELLEKGASKETVFKGIGINNIDERIKLRYGSGFGLFIDSETGCGTTVDLYIPYIPWEAVTYDKSADS